MTDHFEQRAAVTKTQPDELRRIGDALRDHFGCEVRWDTPDGPTPHFTAVVRRDRVGSDTAAWCWLGAASDAPWEQKNPGGNARLRSAYKSRGSALFLRLPVHIASTAMGDRSLADACTLWLNEMGAGRDVRLYNSSATEEDRVTTATATATPAGPDRREQPEPAGVEDGGEPGPASDGPAEPDAGSAGEADQRPAEEDADADADADRTAGAEPDAAEDAGGAGPAPDAKPRRRTGRGAKPAGEASGAARGGKKANGGRGRGGQLSPRVEKWAKGRIEDMVRVIPDADPPSTYSVANKWHKMKKEHSAAEAAFRMKSWLKEKGWMRVS